MLPLLTLLTPLPLPPLRTLLTLLLLPLLTLLTLLLLLPLLTLLTLLLLQPPPPLLLLPPLLNATLSLPTIFPASLPPNVSTPPARPRSSLSRQPASGSARTRATAANWRDCHVADALSPSILKRLLKVERGLQQSDSLADG